MGVLTLGVLHLQVGIHRQHSQQLLETAQAEPDRLGAELGLSGRLPGSAALAAGLAPAVCAGSLQLCIQGTMSLVKEGKV